MSRRRKSIVLQRAEYALYRAVAWFARRLTDRAAFRWGTRLGAAARHLLRRRDRLAMRNLRLIFANRKSDQELRAIADACWHHFGREALYSIRMQRMSLQEIAARCPMVNEHLLEQAIARGKGVILISAHYGAWEVGGLVLMSVVKNVRTITRRLDNEFLERDLAQLRSRTGAAVLDRRRAAREMMEALAGNAVIVLLPDQAVLPREGALVPFLGHDAWTTTLPAKLAIRYGSTIVFAFCIADETGHRLEFDAPIQPSEEGESDPVALTTRINAVISRRIEAHPALWLWMHDRWKGTATGESEGVNGE